MPKDILGFRRSFEVKVRIASQLSIECAIRLARVSRGWQDAAESRTYKRLGFTQRFRPDELTDEDQYHDEAYWEFDPRWRRLRRSLRARPARAAHVRELHAYPQRGNSVDVTKIIKWCHGSLRRVSHQSDSNLNQEIHEYQYSSLKQQILEDQYSHLGPCLISADKPLENLSVLELRLEWRCEIADILSLTPNITSLNVSVGRWTPRETDDNAKALKLDRLRSVSLQRTNVMPAMQEKHAAAPHLEDATLSVNAGIFAHTPRATSFCLSLRRMRHSHSSQRGGGSTTGHSNCGNTRNKASPFRKPSLWP